MELGHAMHVERPRIRLGSRLFTLLVLLPLACLLVTAIGFGPSPYFWLIPAQILVPWIAFGLVWYFPGVISFDGGWDDKYVAWSAVVLLITLPARIAYYYVALLNETSALLAAFIVSAILCLAAALIESDRLARRDRFVMIFWLLPAMLYSHAAAIQLNCVLDNSPATVYRSVVIKKPLEYGTMYHPHYWLRVEPWGAEHGAKDAGVSSRTYHSVHVGETVCVVQREGWLGLRWFTVQTCPWRGGPVFLGEVRGSR
jgi:hypothetical protein